MKAWVLSMSLLMFTDRVSGVFDEKAFSVRSAGMGGTGVSFAEGGVEANPAGLYWMSIKSVSAWETRVEGISDLSHKAVEASFPTKNFGAGGIFYSRFGPDYFNEEVWSVAYSNGAGPRASLGVSFKYYRLNQFRYGKISALGGNAGIFVRPASWVSGGWALTNFNRPRFKGHPEGPLSRMRAGVSFHPPLGWRASLEGVKSSTEKTSLRVGAEAPLGRILFLRLGFFSEPDVYTAGMGIHWKGVRFDYAFQNFGPSGDRQSAGVSFFWGEKSDSCSAGP